MEKLNYYLMRHGSYYNTDNQFVTYFGMLQMKESVDTLFSELSTKFPGKKVHIIHSLLQRAHHSALLVKEMLLTKGLDVFITGDPRLNCDKLEINQTYINEVTHSCRQDNTICVIISHEPDIEFFCNKRLRTSGWIEMTTEEAIEQNEPNTTEESDDLPF